MTHDEMIAVIQAHKDGKIIQSKSKGKLGKFSDVEGNDPTWNFNAADYRVKPEPHTAYAVIDKGGNTYWYNNRTLFSTSKEADNALEHAELYGNNQPYRMVKLREVSLIGS